MTDDLNVNENLYNSSTPAEELNKDVGGEMIPLYEEITIMKTEVKEEINDFEMYTGEMEFVNTEQEPHFSPKNTFEGTDWVLAKSTEQSLNENLVAGNCEIKEEDDFENNKYRCHLCHSEFGEEIFLRSHYAQCLLAKKILPESKKGGETYECMHCTYSTPAREHFLVHIAIHKGCIRNDNLTKHKLVKHSPKPKKYHCKDYKYDTHSKVNLSQQMHVHTNDKPCIAEPKKYKCSNCNYATDIKTNLVSHNRIHTGERPFKCTYKNCKCTAEQEESCECGICCYTATINANLIKHILAKHSEEPKKYKCNTCEFATRFKSNLVTHNYLHSGEKSFKCTYKDCKCTPEQQEFCECIKCEFSYSSNKSLKQHVLLKHSTQSKRYKCSNCKYATYNKTNLVIHNSVHTGEKAFKCTYKNCRCTSKHKEYCECNICEFTTTSNNTLKQHILLKHSTEPKKHKCNHCKFATHMKAKLVIHNRTHTGEKPFKCTYKNCKCTPGQEKFCECNTCEFASKSVSYLKQHILTKHSTEPKKHKCNHCKYATHIKGKLVIHNRAHTGEKPFKCTYKNCKCTPGQEKFCECNTCEFTSANSSHLNRHILRKHAEKRSISRP